MYQRSYNELERHELPPRYDGVAFTEEPDTAVTVGKDSTEQECREASGTGILSGLFGGELLGKIKLPELHTEELLLLAAAAFLFFSRDGDKECAILILLLVFLG